MFFLLFSAARVPTLESNLEDERAGRRALEIDLDNVREEARLLENLKEGSARDNEKILGALQGQVDAANKVWCESCVHSSAEGGRTGFFGFRVSAFRLINVSDYDREDSGDPLIFFVGVGVRHELP